MFEIIIRLNNIVPPVNVKTLLLVARVDEIYFLGLLHFSGGFLK